MADNKDKDKKQLLLRLSPSLWESLAEWAEDDFRSINGQIEYLLSESVKKRKRDKKKESQTTGIPD
ncbi:MAG TPA: Arc family DNA-binding protein [Fusibacter sp.]|nr:Arc family DNA-binding protein [Fusibacter sp.]